MTDLQRYMWLKFSESLTDEERDFLVGQDRERNQREVMTELSKIKKQSSFGLDFLSNVSGNAAYDIGAFLLEKLFRKLR